MIRAASINIAGRLLEKIPLTRLMQIGIETEKEKLTAFISAFSMSKTVLIGGAVSVGF